jgi:Protein of unknown function (DUF3152)
MRATSRARRAAALLPLVWALAACSGTSRSSVAPPVPAPSTSTPAPTAASASATSSPSATPSPAPSPTGSASPSVATAGLVFDPVVQHGKGTFDRAGGTGRRAGTGPLRRYTVAVEDGLDVDADVFAAAVERTLSDPRSWGHGGRLSFQRVADGPVSFRVLLASPDTVDRLCAPLRTNGRLSCGSGTTAVVNMFRWEGGADAYAGDLASYRQYVVNHEVGHTIGHGHAPCPAAGRSAPVMMQQTKGIGACRPNPWPFP